MYCVNCGRQIPDESNYCSNCGEPQKPDVAPVQTRFEICEIVFACEKDAGFFGNDKLRFWAKATGKNGNYNAGESEIFEGSKRYGPSSAYDEDVTAHNGLVKQLLTNGWERIETQGDAWFSFRFRRSLKEHKSR